MADMWREADDYAHYMGEGSTDEPTLDIDEVTEEIEEFIPEDEGEPSELKDEIHKRIEKIDEEGEDTGQFRSGYRIYRDGTEREDFGSDR